MDEKIRKASNGASASGGGLNVPDILKVLADGGVSVPAGATRAVLNGLLKANLGKLVGDAPSPAPVPRAPPAARAAPVPRAAPARAAPARAARAPARARVDDRPFSVPGSPRRFATEEEMLEWLAFREENQRAYQAEQKRMTQEKEAERKRREGLKKYPVIDRHNKQRYISVGDPIEIEYLYGQADAYRVTIHDILEDGKVLIYNSERYIMSGKGEWTREDGKTRLSLLGA